MGEDDKKRAAQPRRREGGMTTYTDEDVDAVALAIVNHRIARMMLPALTSLEGLSCDDIRAEVRAALAARDALFETVRERWEVRWPVRRDEPDGPHTSTPWGTPESAHADANEMRRGAFVGVRVVHVVTKRRTA